MKYRKYKSRSQMGVCFADPGKPTACGSRGCSPQSKSWSWDKVTCKSCLEHRNDKEAKESKK